VERSIAAKLANQAKVVGELYSRTGKHSVYYSRMSRGAPKPASAGRSKPAGALTMHIPHRFDSVQHSLELLVSNQDA